MISPALLKAAALAGAMAVAFGGGWTVNGWRLDKNAATLATQHAEALTAAYERTREAQAALQTQKDLQTGAVSMIDANELTKLRKAQNENETLRGRVAAGTVRLRVAADCPRPSDNVSTSEPATGVDSGARASLTAAAGQDYFALRAGIALTERTLAACQRAAAVLTSPP